MTLTIHHLQVSQSERIPWLCEELGVPYELVLHQRDPILSPPELKKMTALGAAPVIFDTASPYSEAQPLKLAESAAIVQYIAEKHGGCKLMLTPAHKEYGTYVYWWHFANGNLQSSLSRNNALRAVADAENPLRARYEERFQTILKHIDEQLGNGPWLAGEEFTVADIMSMFSFTRMRKFYSFSLAGYDNILAWLKRCTERPAYLKAQEKADPGLDFCISAEGPPLVDAVKKMLEKK